MKNILENQWKIFLQDITGTTFVKKIKSGIDDFLLSQLKKSQYFSFKAQKIPSMSEQREKEWAEARRGELEMEKYYESLKITAPFKLLSSVSHTKGVVVGVSCMIQSSNNKIQGVGIDIENTHRSIDKEVIKRFMGASTLSLSSQLKAIDYWVLKEAAFKATPRDLQLVVTNYNLIQWDQKTQAGVMVSKSAKCQVKLFTIEDYTLGVSYFRF